jgi:uncharacterized OB-fold protein
MRCEACGYYIHPPQPLCPRCHGWDVAPVDVSGQATVASFTISEYQWIDALPPPYVVAEVELAEQSGLLLMTNIVDIDPGAVRVGLPVEVCFEANGDVFVPLFRPLGHAPP